MERPKVLFANEIQVDVVRAKYMVLQDTVLKTTLGMSKRKIADLYESLPNRNAFTDDICKMCNRLFKGLSAIISSKESIVDEELGSTSIGGSHNTIVHKNCHMYGCTGMRSLSDNSILFGIPPMFRVHNESADDAIPYGYMSAFLSNKGLSFKYRDFHGRLRYFTVPETESLVSLRITGSSVGIQASVSDSRQPEHLNRWEFSEPPSRRRSSSVPRSATRTLDHWELSEPRSRRRSSSVAKERTYNSNVSL